MHHTLLFLSLPKHVTHRLSHRLLVVCFLVLSLSVFGREHALLVGVGLHIASHFLVESVWIEWLLLLHLLVLLLLIALGAGGRLGGRVGSLGQSVLALVQDHGHLLVRLVHLPTFHYSTFIQMLLHAGD